LPGNVLLAVGTEITYSLVEVDGEQCIVASKRVKDVFEGKAYKEVKTVKAAELLGSCYEPLFPYFKDHANAFRVVAGDFVTTEDGTGIVHIAPGFGENDMHLGREEEVEPILHVEMSGRLVPELEDALAEEGYDVKGWAVKNKEDHMHVDVEMVKWLAHHGKLFAKKKIVHSYPVCWRTDVPLINYAASSWFVKVTDLRDRLVATNKEINWVPGHMKEGRFGKWLEDARDWAVSRSRYWGTPLPIWKSEDGDVLCIGSVEELEALTGQTIVDLHKHIVDELVIEKDGKTYHRIPDVLDCWFESGSMPYAQGHYPFEGEQQFDGGFPAEFIAEGQDQTRGWFYTLHVLANALFDMPAYKNVVVNGIVLAEDGKKMSKRLKNYPDPMEVMERYGSDAVRHYLMASPVVRAENLRFSEKDVHEVEKKFISIMRNVQTFYALYKDTEDGRAPALHHPLDRWIIARLNETLKEETEALETYDLQRAARSLQPFVTDLSTWYVRRSRDRLKVEGEDQKEALATLREVFQTFSRMIAPFMPFLAEILYQEVNGDFAGERKQLSVHLEDWPEPGEIDVAILDEMGEARALVSRMLDAREEAGVPIKQPLAMCTLTVPAGVIGDELLAVILDEVNVKSAEVKKGEIAAELDFLVTPELRREGLLRDVVRRVNALRKEAGKTIDDRIHLRIYSEHPDVQRMFEDHVEALKAATLADGVEFTEETGEVSAEMRTKEIDIRVSF
ncbi:MAG: class I tRNA ligase family protein, partial [bacterium]|nr:class I tRNA ligase family protein [bacterium]